MTHPSIKPNQDIRELLQMYDIKYDELLEFMPNFSHVQRIYEEMRKEMGNERKKAYILAIEKVKEKKRKIYEN